MPWPTAVATVTPGSSRAVPRGDRPHDGEVVRAVLDRRGPRLADPEVLRDRHVRCIALFHRVEVRPVDLVRRPGRFIRVRHAEQEPALLQSPVQADRVLEDHRLAFDVEGLVRLGDGDLMPDAPTKKRAPTSFPTARSVGPPVRSSRSVAIVPSGVSTPDQRAVAPSADAEERRPLEELDARLAASRASTRGRSAAGRRTRRRVRTSRRGTGRVQRRVQPRRPAASTYPTSVSPAARCISTRAVASCSCESSVARIR